VVYSKKENEISQKGWIRKGEDISYFKNGISKDGVSTLPNAPLNNLN
jgi:hypothetical protein